MNKLTQKRQKIFEFHRTLKKTEEYKKKRRLKKLNNDNRLNEDIHGYNSVDS